MESNKDPVCAVDIVEQAQSSTDGLRRRGTVELWLRDYNERLLGWLPPPCVLGGDREHGRCGGWNRRLGRTSSFCFVEPLLVEALIKM